ncbi:hypothetical protein [Paenibacillus sp. FSL L8-0494]|uniref:hypothetical protein n=1 Tax=Paenibacillus sp. FSL L8-0494 TaxID=2975352 RepID=UPI0030F883A2
MDNELILGIGIANEKETGNVVFVERKSVNYIDIWSPKKNYHVPRFHSGSEMYGVLTTLEACKVAFPKYLQADTGKLVNMDSVIDVTESRFALTLHFVDGSTTNMAKYKRNLVKNLKDCSKNNSRLSQAKDEFLIGTKVEKGKETGEVTYFDKKHIKFIDVWEPKKNYHVPLFHTMFGNFSEMLTLEACRAVFNDYLMLDTGKLVNLNFVDYVEENKFALILHFLDRSTTDMAKYKKDIVYHLIKKSH